MIVSGRLPSPATATAQYEGKACTVWLPPSPMHRYVTPVRRWPALRKPRSSSLSPAFGPKIVSISSNRIVGRPLGLDTDRNRAAADAFTAVMGCGTRVSTTSSARDFPDPGSGERKARRGVESKQSSRWACASHRVTAM